MPISDNEEQKNNFVGIFDLDFEIPPVQRGLVWSPSQVIELWDSISKGYPIGSFITYQDKNDKNKKMFKEKVYNNSLSGWPAALQCHPYGNKVRCGGWHGLG